MIPVHHMLQCIEALMVEILGSMMVIYMDFIAILVARMVQLYMVSDQVLPVIEVQIMVSHGLFFKRFQSS